MSEQYPINAGLTLPNLDAVWMLALIDARTQRVAPRSTVLFNTTVEYADFTSPGANENAASIMTETLTVAASGTTDQRLGLAASISAVKFDYSFLRNSEAGAGSGMLFHNTGTAVLGGGGKFQERAENVDGSKLTFSLNINGNDLEIRMVNADGANAVTIILFLVIFPRVS